MKKLIAIAAPVAVLVALAIDLAVPAHADPPPRAYDAIVAADAYTQGFQNVEVIPNGETTELRYAGVMVCIVPTNRLILRPAGALTPPKKVAQVEGPAENGRPTEAPNAAAGHPSADRKSDSGVK